MSEITFPEDVDRNLLKVLTQIAENLQRQYDISAQVLNSLLNYPDMNFKELAQEEWEKMQNRLQDLETAIMEQNQNAEQNTLTESEECGYLEAEYPNGYRKYCNSHKYLHHDIQTHSFVFKNRETILQEELFQAKQNAYQQFLDTLLQRIHDQIIATIHQEYCILRVPVNQVLSLTEWLQTHPELFKSKILLGQVQEGVSDGSMGDNNRFTFQNCLDLYFPKANAETYFAQMQQMGIDLSGSTEPFTPLKV